MVSSAKFQEISSDFAGKDLYGQMSPAQDIAGVLRIITPVEPYQI
jgi:hypothetical protein